MDGGKETSLPSLDSTRIAMPSIHAVATLTAKGQITLPKSIRQALGVDAGGKVVFDIKGSEVVVSRVDEESEEDPAIAGFLAVLERDIRNGSRIVALPHDSAQAMRVAGQAPDIVEDGLGLPVDVVAQARDAEPTPFQRIARAAAVRLEARP
jgi:antitoxin PrlF